jgi:hypothetical protein
MGEEDHEGRRISYWLIPAEPHKSRFSKIISDFAQRFDGPIFEPHVTVYSGRAAKADDVEHIVAQSSAISEIVLPTAGVGHSGEFTKTLFVRLEMSEPIRQLASALKSRITVTDAYALEPHLSLLYAAVDFETRNRLAAELHIPEAIRFDALHAIGTGVRIESRGDVEQWRWLTGRCLQFAR